MNRSSIREIFRLENPELTDRVVTDALLNTWIDAANQEICAATRCLVSNEREEITAVVDQQFYDLESYVPTFFDIDDMPGGGVYYDDVPLKKATASEMNTISSTWRLYDSGTPKKYWRRGKFLWFDRAPDDDLVISFDCVYNASPMTDDSQSPYNGLEHLKTYNDGVNKYLQVRAKQKLGKYSEGSLAQKEYEKYVLWMKKSISGYSNRSIAIVPGDRVGGLIR